MGAHSPRHQQSVGKTGSRVLMALMGYMRERNQKHWDRSGVVGRRVAGVGLTPIPLKERVTDSGMQTD